MDLRAADALDAVAAQMDLAYSEYHRDVDQFDRSRRAAVLAAYIQRVTADAADRDRLASHTTQVLEAMDKIEDDRSVESARFAAARSHAAAVREVARGLRRIGIESMTLQDEYKRYFGSLLENYRAAQSAPVGGGPVSPTSAPALPRRVSNLVAPAFGRIKTAGRSDGSGDECPITDAVRKILGK